MTQNSDVNKTGLGGSSARKKAAAPGDVPGAAALGEKPWQDWN